MNHAEFDRRASILGRDAAYDEWDLSVDALALTLACNGEACAKRRGVLAAVSLTMQELPERLWPEYRKAIANFHKDWLSRHAVFDANGQTRFKTEAEEQEEPGHDRIRK